MFEAEVSITRIEEIKQIAINLERQVVGLDHELVRYKDEIRRLKAIEHQQKQALRVTQETILILEAK